MTMFFQPFLVLQLLLFQSPVVFGHAQRRSQGGGAGGQCTERGQEQVEDGGGCVAAFVVLVFL